MAICGAAAGLGPRASDTLDDRHTIACLSEEVVTPILRDFEALEEAGTGCSSSEPWSPGCSIAASRVCEDAGLRTGFGPRLYTEDGIELGCTPSAERLLVSYESLAEHHADCSSSKALRTGPCLSLIHI